MSATDQYLATQTYEDIYYVPPPTWLRVFSLGHHEALADILWLRALVYFGDELIHHGGVAHVFDYTEAMLGLDPDFKAVYRWAGVAGMYRPVDVSVEDIKRSIEFLERGARRFPDDGRLLWDTGASLCFELAPWIDDPAEKRRVNLRGLAYLEAASRLGAAPDWLVFTTASQLRRFGETDRAIQHLEEMYATVRDEDTRMAIQAELATLRSEHYASTFRAAYDNLEEQRLRDFPYVPPPLHVLLGHRPPVSPDSDASHEIVDFD